MNDTALRWMSMLLMTGAAISLAWFIEAILKPFFQRATAGLGLPIGGAPAAQESVLAAPSTPTALTQWNARFLENPWVLQFLERDYYGVGQKKEYEPAKLLLAMEKSGAMGAFFVVIFSLWAAIPLNPGLIFMGFVGGFFFPHLQARNIILERQKQVLMNLPSFVDLLALTIESGLDYLNSMERIVGGTLGKRGTLDEEVENVLREVSLGYPRRDALRHFARRVDVQEIRSLVGLLIQSDELGTGLVNLLRNFSQDMRNRRTGKAEEMAGKAATKMLGPMMIFIFPVIFALILAPFAFSLMKGGEMPF